MWVGMVGGGAGLTGYKFYKKVEICIKILPASPVVRELKIRAGILRSLLCNAMLSLIFPYRITLTKRIFRYMWHRVLTQLKLVC